MIALSIRQPWAWLILHAGKDVENRSWPTKFRGRFLIHAAKGMTQREYENACQFARYVVGINSRLPAFKELPRGGIVGEAEIWNCVSESSSKWFEGPHGFLIRKAVPLEFRPLAGTLGFFHTE